MRLSATVFSLSIAFLHAQSILAQYLGLSVDEIYAKNYPNGTANSQAVTNFLQTGPRALVGTNIAQQWYALQYDATPNEFAVLATFTPAQGDFAQLPNRIMGAVDLATANVTQGTPTLADVNVLSSKVSPAPVQVGLRCILVAKQQNINDVANYMMTIPDLLAQENYTPQWFATQLYNTTTSAGTNTFVMFLFAENYEQISFSLIGNMADLFNGAQNQWLMAQPDLTYYTVVASYVNEA